MIVDTISIHLQLCKLFNLKPLKILLNTVDFDLLIEEAKQILVLNVETNIVSIFDIAVLEVEGTDTLTLEVDEGGVVKLVNTEDLKSSSFGFAGSIPATPTNKVQIKEG